MLTIRRDCVPGICAKFTVRFEPSAAMNATDPDGAPETNALCVIADKSGTESSGFPIMLAWSAGAASTTPALSTRTDEMPGRPPRLFMIFDNQSRLMPATTTESCSGLIAATG